MVAALARRPDAAPAEAPTTARDHALPALRFITCGSVDDGKSTLIGRMIFESGSVPDDILAGLESDSRKFGTTGGGIDYALLVDGLAAEREQGITIDVAYRYFSTSRRSFIVADTPGHEEYTRNMATGASTAQCAIVLIDARKGVLPQTRRHAFIVAMFGIRHVIVAINKMDLVGFDQAVFSRIEHDFRDATAELGFSDIRVIPVSARDGDNLAKPSDRTPWFRGEPLLAALEALVIPFTGLADRPFAMPVQIVNRPDANFRGFSGTVATGRIALGSPVVAHPSGRISHVSRIVGPGGDQDIAAAGEAVTLCLADEIDLSRGDFIGAPLQGSERRGLWTTADFGARLLVTADQRISTGRELVLKLGTAMVPAKIVSVDQAINIASYQPEAASFLAMNGIGTVHVHCAKPITLGDYRASPVLGGFILIDPGSCKTVAFGIADAPAHNDAGAHNLHTRKWLAGKVIAFRRRYASDAALRREIRFSMTAAILLGGTVGLITGNAVFGLGALLYEAAARPLARRGHALWCSRNETIDPSLDGGGI